MQNQLQQNLKYLTHWHSDEMLGQTLSLMLLDFASEIQHWQARPERLLVLHAGPFEDLGAGLMATELAEDAVQRLSYLRFAKLVLRKNSPEQLDVPVNGWHVHAFYPIPELPLWWSGDTAFRYLAYHIAGYFVAGIESSGDGTAAFASDIKLIHNSNPAQLQYLIEMLEPLLERSWPAEVGAAFWQEQLNRPLILDYSAAVLLEAWATHLRNLLVTITISS
jgi:hypothetical protein